MPKKIVVFYYSQTGQVLDIAQQICAPAFLPEVQVIYKEIIPRTSFPFPWNADDFFQAFPESRMGISCPIIPFDLEDVSDVDLVIIAWQPWYLSPSIPVHAFFQSPQIRVWLKGRTVLSVIGSRNMWTKALEKIKEYIHTSGATLVGNISLCDRHPNLISVATIIRWLLYGKKEGGFILPSAGVSDRDILESQRFGIPIKQALMSNDWSSLNDTLIALGAMKYSPSLAFIESAGHRIFGIWARIILRKGAFGDRQRRVWLYAFRYYLFAVLYIASPFGILFFYLTLPFRLQHIRKHKKYVLGTQ